MEPGFDPARSDLPMESSPWTLRIVSIPAVAVMIPVLAIGFGMGDSLIRPFALAFGKPATAIISSKRVSHGRRTAGNYVEVNYQYAPGFAPRPELQVDDAAYAALVEGKNVPIHYIPGCSSCVALDEDYGTSRRDGIMALVIAGLFVVVAFFQRLAQQIRDRP